MSLDQTGDLSRSPQLEAAQSASLERFPLTVLNSELAALTGRAGPGYRKLYLKVLDGLIPAERVDGRYFVRRVDLPGIAVTLGLASPVAA